jgi:hypothetical protein
VIRPTDRPPDSSVNEADEVDTLPNPEGDVPDTVYLFEHGSPFNAQESDTLSTSLADPVHVRASFHIEPEWLKTKMAWEDRAQFHREFDTKGAKYIEYQTWYADSILTYKVESKRPMIFVSIGVMSTIYSCRPA